MTGNSRVSEGRIGSGLPPHPSPVRERDVLGDIGGEREAEDDYRARNVVLSPNVTLAENVSVAGACDHDWRVNPVVCTTTPTGDCELLMCLKCGATKAGVLLSRSRVLYPPDKERHGPFDPETWAKR